MMDYQEGYCDGLAGVGVQHRNDADYGVGFCFGSLDRKTMLAPDAFHRWADGLMNSTAGDVLQPVEGDLWADGMGDGNAQQGL